MPENAIRRAMKIRTASIKIKLIVAVALVHSILMSLFVYDLVERQSEFLRMQSTDATVSLAQTLAANSTSWVLANDIIGMEEIIKSQSRYPGLKYAMLISPQGRLLSHTDRTLTGDYLSDAISLKLLTRPPEIIKLVNSQFLVDVAVPVFANKQQIAWARIGLSHERTLSELHIISRDGIIYTLIAIAIGTLIAWLLAQNFTAGLYQLSVIAEKVRQGERGLRASLNRHDEIGKLAEYFDAMLISLEENARDLARFRTALDSSRDYAFLIDPVKLKFIDFNLRVVNDMGYSREELLNMDLQSISPFGSESELRDLFINIIEHPLQYEMLSTIYQHRDGNEIPVEIKFSVLTEDNQSDIIVAIARNVSGRIEHERKLNLLNHSLRAFVEVQDVLIRARDENELLDKICRIIVDTGDYNLAWIGYAEDDEQKSIKPVAQYGYEDDYVETIHVTWVDNELGRGPTGTAIRTGKPVVEKNIHNNPSYEPWRKQAEERGYASSIALPLISEGHSFGALNIYSAEPGSFNDQEVGLLMELAENLAFGIHGQRLRVLNRQSGKELEVHRDHLEERVEERTRELHKKSEELSAFNEAMVGREMRIIELKVEVNRLMSELGKQPPYQAVWES